MKRRHKLHSPKLVAYFKAEIMCVCKLHYLAAAVAKTHSIKNAIFKKE